MPAQAIAQPPLASAFRWSRTLRWIAGIGLVAALIHALSQTGLTDPARTALGVFGTALVAWIVLDLPETPVALTGALALVLSGTVREQEFFDSFGSEIVVLMVGAFLLSAALRQSGAMDLLSRVSLARCRTVTSLFWVSTLVISATAFLIPSTSARAAMLLPVYQQASGSVDRARVATGLALLFPSVVLLSAAASLTGAGAHLVAAEFINRMGDKSIGFVEWAMLAAPFAWLTSLVACSFILMLYLRRDDRRAPLAIAEKAGEVELTRQHWNVLGIVALTILGFASTGVHGQSIAVIALVGALAATARPISGISLKDGLRAVDWNLLLFLIGTLVMGEALLSSGGAEIIVTATLGMLAPDAGLPAIAIVAMAATLSALAHLIINSRTARASVLIPTLALPLSAYGVDPVLLILVTVIGSGFCQTLTVSAKPVAMFSAEGGFTQKQLLLLAALLLPVFIALLVLFATLVWPAMGLSL